MTETTFAHTTQQNKIPFSYEIEAGEGLSRIARVRVDAGRIDGLWNEKISGYSKKVKLPGFRPGKIPGNVIKQRFGEGLKAETLEEALREVYPDVLAEQEDVAGVVRVDIEGGLEATDGAHAFVVEYEVNPEFDVKLPKKIAIKAPSDEVSDAEVASALETLRQERATYEPKESGAENGDFVDLEYSLVENDEALGEPRTHRIELGQNTIHADIDAALLGAKDGTEATVTITHTEEDAGAFAGRTIQYELRVNGVSVQTLPEVNDEFAQSFQGIENLDAMKDAIRDSMKAERHNEQQQAVHNALMEALRETNPLDMPQSYIAQVQQQKAEQLLGQFQQQGLVQKEQLDQTRQFAMQAVRGAAETAAHDAYLIGKLGDTENPDVSDEDLAARLEALGGQYGMTAEQVRNELGDEGLQSVRLEVRNGKALDTVKEKAKIEYLSWDEWQSHKAEVQAQEAAAQAQQ